MTHFRVGIGYDIHRLVEGRPLFIGGVEIPYIKGLLGHSDADALTHALCDALLGAIGAGDIGEHFPDTDPKYQNVYSIELLKEVMLLVKDRGYRINNVDATVIAQEPALSSFKARIREKISAVLQIDSQLVSIKAKTNEGLGEIGKKDAIASIVTVSLTGEVR